MIGPGNANDFLFLGQNKGKCDKAEICGGRSLNSSNIIAVFMNQVSLFQAKEISKRVISFNKGNNFFSMGI